MAVDWIQTLENRALFPRALTKESVGSIREIAHSLAYNFRFTRQLERPYSVAEHCVRGSRLLSPAFAGAFLLHELSEVYLPDIPAPLKPSVYVYLTDRCDEDPTPWAELERQHTHVMLDALGLLSLEPMIYSTEVRAMDLAMLAAEKKWLVGPEPMPWGLNAEPPALYAEGCIHPMQPGQAESEFLSRFDELFATP